MILEVDLTLLTLPWIQGPASWLAFAREVEKDDFVQFVGHLGLFYESARFCDGMWLEQDFEVAL